MSSQNNNLEPEGYGQKKYIIKLNEEGKTTIEIKDLLNQKYKSEAFPVPTIHEVVFKWQVLQKIDCDTRKVHPRQLSEEQKKNLDKWSQFGLTQNQIIKKFVRIYEFVPQLFFIRQTIDKSRSKDYGWSNKSRKEMREMITKWHFEGKSFIDVINLLAEILHDVKLPPLRFFEKTFHELKTAHKDKNVMSNDYEQKKYVAKLSEEGKSTLEIKDLLDQKYNSEALSVTTIFQVVFKWQVLQRINHDSSFRWPKPDEKQNKIIEKWALEGLGQNEIMKEFVRKYKYVPQLFCIRQIIDKCNGKRSKTSPKYTISQEVREIIVKLHSKGISTTEIKNLLAEMVHDVRIPCADGIEGTIYKWKNCKTIEPNSYKRRWNIEEKTQIVEWGKEGKSVREIRILFSLKYDRIAPCRQSIQNIIKKWKLSASFRSGGKTALNEDERKMIIQWNSEGKSVSKIHALFLSKYKRDLLLKTINDNIKKWEKLQRRESIVEWHKEGKTCSEIQNLYEKKYEVDDIPTIAYIINVTERWDAFGSLDDDPLLKKPTLEERKQIVEWSSAGKSTAAIQEQFSTKYDKKISYCIIRNIIDRWKNLKTLKYDKERLSFNLEHRNRILKWDKEGKNISQIRKLFIKAFPDAYVPCNTTFKVSISKWKSNKYAEIRRILTTDQKNQISDWNRKGKSRKEIVRLFSQKFKDVEPLTEENVRNVIKTISTDISLPTNRCRFTEEHRRQIYEWHCEGKTLRETKTMFATKFKSKFVPSFTTITSIIKWRSSKKCTKMSPMQIRKVKNWNSIGKSISEIIKLFRARYGYKLSEKTIKYMMKKWASRRARKQVFQKKALVENSKKKLAANVEIDSKTHIYSLLLRELNKLGKKEISPEAQKSSVQEWNKKRTSFESLFVISFMKYTDKNTLKDAIEEWKKYRRI